MSEQDQLRWRCRRGLLELDLLLQDFLAQGLEDLNECESATFARLLEYPDNTLLEVLMGRQTAAQEDVARVAEKIRRAARHRT